MLKIAFIVPFLFRYQRGIERSCVHLANELVRMGHQVTLIAWRFPDSTSGFQIDPQIRIVTVPYARYYQLVWAILSYVYELVTNQHEIVYIYFAGYGEAPALRFARLFYSFRINFIVGYPYEQVPHRFKEFDLYKLSPLLNKVIVKSPAMVADVAKFFDRDDIAMIPNGVDAALFDPQRINAEPLRKQLGFNQHDPVLLTVAALEERKGIQHIIQVLPELLQIHSHVKYVVVGDGPYQKELAQLTAAVGVEKAVRFVGVIDNVLPYYKLADIFLLISYGEGFPNVLLEAWAMELPVVVSEAKPYPDIVQEEIGFQVHGEDKYELIAILAKLIDDPVGRNEMGRRCRQHVGANYTWHIRGKQIIDLEVMDRLTG